MRRKGNFVDAPGISTTRARSVYLVMQFTVASFSGIATSSCGLAKAVPHPFGHHPIAQLSGF